MSRERSKHIDIPPGGTILSAGEPAGQSLLPLHLQRDGGKSGLRRIRCQVTPGGREPTESATENRPPKSLTAKALKATAAEGR